MTECAITHQELSTIIKEINDRIQDVEGEIGAPSFIGMDEFRYYEIQILNSILKKLTKFERGK